MSKCICEGNWRLIVEEYEPAIGKYFKDNRNQVFKFFGLVHGDDDYYYGLWNVSTRELTLASCVGSLEGNGYTPCEAPTLGVASPESTAGEQLESFPYISNPDFAG